MPDYFFRSNLYLDGATEELLFRTNTYTAVSSASVVLGATLATAGLRLSSEPLDLATGNTIRWSNVVGGALTDVTIYDDASLKAASSVTAFDFEVDDGSGYATAGTVSFQPVIDTGGGDPGSVNIVITIGSRKSILVK